MGQVFFFACTAAFNPTLLAATTVMLLMPSPKRLLLGYLCGALLTSVTLGVIIVLSLNGSSGATSATQNTLSPAADFTLGGILLVVSLVLLSGRDEAIRERRRRKKEGKPAKEPRWQRALSKGNARDTFVVGVLLTLPGASYLASLNELSKQDLSTAPTVLTVLAINAIMLLLLELPLLCYAIAPEWTPQAIERFKAWFSRHARGFGIYGCGGIGAALVIRGLITVLA
ncbi:MAG: GAP family protein [Solirubrobacterales bacterium]